MARQHEVPVQAPGSSVVQAAGVLAELEGSAHVPVDQQVSEQAASDSWGSQGLDGFASGSGPSGAVTS
jgi:hypothetical protein